jgi:hypothetical protein
VLKDVRAFSGTLSFRDLFDKEITSVTLTHEDGLRAGSTAVWKGGIEFNQFIPAHQRLLSIAPTDLQVSFATDVIIYKDGTRERLGA